MPDQPAIEKRIAEIVRTHRSNGRGRAQARCYGCDWKVAEGTHADHVATLLVAELGLIRETADTYFGDHKCVTVCRYVTEWVPDVP